MEAITTTATSSGLSPETLTAAIKQEHAAVSRAAQSALQHALAAGRLLAEAKATIPHGSWEAYVKDSCGIAPRTASLYQHLHRHRDRLPNRQHVAELSVRQAARLLEQPKAKAETECDDGAKAEYWAAKINAAWAAMIAHLEADVKDIAESLSDDSMPPKERRKRDRILRERAGELAEMKAAQSRARARVRAKSFEPSPRDLQLVAAHAEDEQMRAKTIAICAETDHLLSVVRTLSTTLPEGEQQSVAAFVNDLAEKQAGLRRKVERLHGAWA
jgi:hypothetical protein